MRLSTAVCFQETGKNLNNARERSVATISYPKNVERWGWFCVAVIVLLGIAAGPVFGAFSDQTATLAPTADSSSLPDERVQVSDIDSDGDPDFSANGRLWRNDISDNGTFLFLGAILDMGPWGDHNNDGKPDLYGHQSAIMYTNQTVGIPSFDSDGPKPGQSDGDPNMPFLPAGDGFPPDDLTSNGTNRSACWGDWDKDGDLDLFVAGSQAQIGDPIWPDVILNNGLGGTPQNFVRSSVGGSSVYARGSHPCDYDKDGDLDIYVCNYYWVPNRLLQNNGSGSFTDVGVAAGVAGNPDVGMGHGATIGAAWGDLNNDGEIDLVVANLNHLDNRIAENALIYQNNGSPNYDFTQVFEFSPGNNDWVEAYSGAVLFDYDNDGDLDVFMTEVYGNDPRLYRNDGSFTFVNVTGTEMAEVSLNASGQSAVLDWDDDGDLDLINGGMLLQNDNNNGNHWLKVKFEAVDAVIYGARVCIDLGGGKILTRTVNEMVGEGNQNDRTVHFGLGTEAGPVTVEVKFLDGSTATVNTAVDQTVTIASTCENKVALGDGLLEDLNGDCMVDYLDFAILHENYLRCNNPGDGACEVVDVDPPFDPNSGFLIDFEDNPDILSPPWSFAGGAYAQPKLGNGNAPNTSRVLDPDDFTLSRLDLTHPDVNQAGTKGSVEVDIYYQQGGNRIHLRDNTGWSAAWVNVWGNGGGSNAEISLQTATWTTAFQATDAIVPGTWNTIRIDWDTSTQLLSVFLNGAPLSTLQNVSAMEPDIPGGWPGVAVTELVLYTWTGTVDTTQFDNVRFRDEGPTIPFWAPETVPDKPFFPVDFEDSPDVTAAPWGFAGGAYSVPQLGTGNPPNTSIVLDPLDYTLSSLDLTHPDVNATFAQGSLEFDTYWEQGVSRIHLTGPTSWNILSLYIWNNGGDSRAEIALQSAVWTTVAEEPNTFMPGTWNTFRVDWDMTTELISVSLNGAPLANLQDVDAMEPGYNNFPSETPTSVRFYTWTGTADTAQFDNICVSDPNGCDPNSAVTLNISGNVGLPGVTLEGFPGDPVISGAGGDYNVTVAKTTAAGTVVPRLAGYVFTPKSRSYGSLPGNLTGQDYTPQAIDCDLLQSLGHIINGDITGDCYVNEGDAAGLSLQWLECNHPDQSACP